MAITQTVNVYDIIDLVNKYGRMDNFGYHGWKKLFEYMENLSDDMGEDMELDIVAWCCEYTMLESAQEVFDAYEQINPGGWEDMNDEEKLEVIEAFLQENTQVVCCEDDCIIFGCF